MASWISMNWRLYAFHLVARIRPTVVTVMALAADFVADQ